MEFRTTKCAQKWHQEFAIYLDDSSNLSPTWLLDYFESEVAAGRKFSAGETVQIGWSVTQLRQAVEALELWEPRFDTMPIEWERGINNTLRHLILQKEVCTQLESEPRFPSLRHPGIIVPGFLSRPGEFVMSRDEPQERDSGWVFKNPDYSGSEGEWRSLFEITIHHPLAIPFLALPSGTTVAIDPKTIQVEFRGKLLTSDSNGFLSQLLNARLM